MGNFALYGRSIEREKNPVDGRIESRIKENGVLTFAKFSPKDYAEEYPDFYISRKGSWGFGVYGCLLESEESGDIEGIQWDDWLSSQNIPHRLLPDHWNTDIAFFRDKKKTN